VTNIPVKIPGSWEPVSKSNENEENLFNYSFFVDYTKDRYCIDVYYVSNPVPISKAIVLNKKYSPIGYQSIGSLEGEKITSDAISLPDFNDKAKDAEEFTLISGVKAYKDKEGANIWWKHKGWMFEYLGNTNSLDRLEELASLWEKTSISIGSGQVKIVEGNKSNAWVTWEQGNIRYSFSMLLGDNLSSIIQCLNSFKSAKEASGSPFLQSLTSEIQEAEELPIRIPLLWDPIAEFDCVSQTDYE